MIEYKNNIIKLIKGNCNVHFTANDYESRFIGMYSISLKDKILLNKVMINLLTNIYEIIFIFLGFFFTLNSCLYYFQRCDYGFAWKLHIIKKRIAIKVRLEEKIGDLTNKAITQGAKVFGLGEVSFLWHRCCIY